MRSRRFTLALVGLGAAAVVTGALVVAATGAASDGQVPTETTRTTKTTVAADRLPCFGSADAAQHWIRSGATSPCVRSRTDQSPRPSDARLLTSCVTTADAAAHWMRETGRLPCTPARRLP